MAAIRVSACGCEIICKAKHSFRPAPLRRAAPRPTARQRSPAAVLEVFRRVLLRHCVAAEASSMDRPCRRSDMIRTVLSVLILTLSGSAGWAQGAPAEGDDSRYIFNRADEGYLRLDGRTGQVSICTRRPVGWACQAVADERTALESEIARLRQKTLHSRKSSSLAIFRFPEQPSRTNPRPSRRRRACNCRARPISTR